MNRVAQDEARRRPSRSAQKARIKGAVFAFVKQDFPVLEAHHMVIEQNRDSMGINYEPGTYRDVTWGERERGLWRIFAGWDEQGALAIHSRSSDIRAVERFSLRDDGRLQVQVDIDGDDRDFSLVRVFERR